MSTLNFAPTPDAGETVYAELAEAPSQQYVPVAALSVNTEPPVSQLDTAYLVKRDGRREKADPLKLIKWGEWGRRNLGNRVNWVSIMTETLSQIRDGMTTDALQDLLIRNTLAYGDDAHARMAGTLYAPHLQKQLYGNKIPTIKELHVKLRDLGLMKHMPYSDKEYAQLEAIIDHTIDFDYRHFQIKHINRKYAIQNRDTNEIYETPQFTFMRMAMEVSSKEAPNKRIDNIREFYRYLNDNTINAPSPNYISLGTPKSGLVSCCLYKTGDTIPSLNTGDTIAYRMTAIGAGIGGLIATRGLGEPVRGGSIVHQGKQPYFAIKGKAVRGNIQSGRAGAAKTEYNIFDVEAYQLASLQNPRTPANRRNRDMHFAVQYHSLFIRKALLNEDVFAFSVRNAPDLFQAFYGPNKQLFEDLYAKYEADEKFVKTYQNARDLLLMCSRQGPEVGTHYEFYSDNINANTPYKEPIYSSNLCMEILQPTWEYEDLWQLYVNDYLGKIRLQARATDLANEAINQAKISSQATEFTYQQSEKFILIDTGTEVPGGELEEGMTVRAVGDEDGIYYQITQIIERDRQPETSLCALGGIVVSNVRDDQHYERAMYHTQRMINYCILNTSYPFPQIEFTAKKRMNAGIGILGLATSLARKNLKYNSKEGLAEIHRISERHMYFAIKCSIQLGRELGNAPWINRTKWADGWLPIDTYKRTVDELCNEPLHYDWEALRAELIAQGGMRFSSLVAHMPTESSSKGAGCPNGVYPIRELAIGKTDATNAIDWTAPDSDLIGHQYQSAWDIPTDALIEAYAVIQKFTDQGISADLYFDRRETLNLSATALLKLTAKMQKYGIKTRYYANSRTDDSSAGDLSSVAGCASGACSL